MEFELEINKILNTIKVRDIKTFEDMNKNIESILDIVYKDYLKYDRNRIHLENAKKKLLNNYEYVETINDINEGDSLIAIDLSRFYNMRLHHIGFCVMKVSDTCIRTINLNRVYNYSCTNRIFFRKLSRADKAKVMLIETIGDL